MLLRWKSAKNDYRTRKRIFYSHTEVKPGQVSWKNGIIMSQQKLLMRKTARIYSQQKASRRSSKESLENHPSQFQNHEITGQV